MAFPRLNALSYWLTPPVALLLIVALIWPLLGLLDVALDGLLGVWPAGWRWRWQWLLAGDGIAGALFIGTFCWDNALTSYNIWAANHGWRLLRPPGTLVAVSATVWVVAGLVFLLELLGLPSLLAWLVITIPTVIVWLFFGR